MSAGPAVRSKPMSTVLFSHPACLKHRGRAESPERPERLKALLLEHWGLLQAPLLYLSLFFKRHREEYYRRLNAVRLEGDWEGWTDFFLDGVATVADEAVGCARDIFTLVSEDRARMLALLPYTVK